MIDQYFALEPVIVDALKAEFEGVPIFTPFNIEQMLTASNEDISLHVIYFDDRVASDAGRGALSTIYQQWLVVLCLRDATAQLQQTNAIRAKAQPYIKKLLSVMQGFDPDISGVDVFKRANSPVRASGQSSFCYLPFMFEIQLYIEG